MKKQIQNQKVPKVFFVLFIVLVAVISSQAGELQLEPQKPEAGTNLSIRYKSTLKSNKLFAVAYLFNQNDPLPKTIDLKFEKLQGNYEAMLRVEENTVFGLIKVVDKDNWEIDDNRTQFWDFLVYENGQAVEAANLRAAFSYMGNMPTEFRRFPDLYEAENYLEREINLNKDNQLAKIANLSLQFDLRKINQEEFTTQMKFILNKKFNTKSESEVRAVSRALKTINKNDVASKIEMKFANEFPKSDLAAEMKISKLSEASSLDQFLTLAEDYFQNYPTHLSNKKISSAYVNAFTQGKKLDELESKIKTVEYLPNDVKLFYLNYLMNISDKERIRNQLNDISFELDGKSIDEQMNLLSDQSMIYGLQADLNNGEVKNRFIDLSVENGKKFTSPKEYIRYIKHYKNLKKVDDLLINSISNDSILFYHKEYYSKENLAGNYEEYLEKITKKAEEKRREELVNKKLKAGKRFGIFRDINGRYLDTEELNGKVTALFLWSSWCGPCQTMIPALEEIESIYFEETDVEIYGLNVWENPESRDESINNFLDENQVKFDILIDDTDRFPQKNGVLGLPAVIFLDADGQLQYVLKGYTDFEEFIRDVEDRIEILRAKTKD